MDKLLNPLPTFRLSMWGISKRVCCCFSSPFLYPRLNTLESGNIRRQLDFRHDSCFVLPVATLLSTKVKCPVRGMGSGASSFSSRRSAISKVRDDNRSYITLSLTFRSSPLDMRSNFSNEINLISTSALISSISPTAFVYCPHQPTSNSPPSEAICSFSLR